MANTVYEVAEIAGGCADVADAAEACFPHSSPLPWRDRFRILFGAPLPKVLSRTAFIMGAYWQQGRGAE